MNAPIKYFGGKGTMYNEIIRHFPRPDYDVYVEPFSGTYTVGLHMPYVPEMEVFNDLERNVYTLYKVIKDESMFAEFRRMLELTPYHEDVRYDARDALRRGELSEVERAYHYFVLNRFSRNGIGGWSVNMLGRRGMSKSISDYLSAVQRLPELHMRLQHVVIYNRDGLELIDRFNSPNCFLYCDPPYAWETRGATRYAVDNDNEWHARFVEKCLASSARILISGYACKTYEELERNGFVKETFDVRTIDGVMRPKTKTECLWRNYHELSAVCEEAANPMQMEFSF